jgi:hypothetical protein
MMRMSGSGEAEIPRDIETGDGGIEESKD